MDSSSRQDRERSYEEMAETVESYRPITFSRRRATFGALDEHFVQNWLTHAHRLLRRPQLDRRKRLLVFTGQYTMLGNLEALEETLEAAISSGVDPRELLEVILQCYVYSGESVVEAASTVFLTVVRRRGLLEQVQEGQLRADATRAGRRLEDEREAWSHDDREDPRSAALIERHGWYGISAGLRLRPGHHLNLLTTLEALDPEFLEIWVDRIYEGMYCRGALDDAPRLLCVVGNCLAVGETHQSRRHMRGALRQGADPIEIMEVIFQSTLAVGHPHLMPMTLDDFVTILDDEGRLEEVVSPDRIEEVRRIAAVRIAKRNGVEEVPTNV